MWKPLKLPHGQSEAHHFLLEHNDCNNRWKLFSQVDYIWVTHGLENKLKDDFCWKKNWCCMGLTFYFVGLTMFVRMILKDCVARKWLWEFHNFSQLTGKTIILHLFLLSMVFLVSNSNMIMMNLMRFLHQVINYRQHEQLNINVMYMSLVNATS